MQCLGHGEIAPPLILFIKFILQNHRFSYGEPMTVESTTQALCDLALRFGEGDEESMVIVAYLLIICLYCLNSLFMIFFLWSFPQL